MLGTWQALGKYWPNTASSINIFSICLLSTSLLPRPLVFHLVSHSSHALALRMYPNHVKLSTRRLKGSPFQGELHLNSPFQKAPPSFINIKWWDFWPQPICAHKHVRAYFQVLVLLRSAQKGCPNPPAVRKLGYINNSYALLLTGARGSGELISFARKGL